MKVNLLKKVVVGGLITSLCLCCCFLNFNKNVNASAINEYQDENGWFEGATNLPNYISSVDDLKGKTFTIPFYTLYTLSFYQFDFYINILERDYIGIEIDSTTHETVQCVDYLQYPYIIIERFNGSSFVSEYSLFSFYLESSNNYPFFYINDTALNPNSKYQLQGSLTSKNRDFTYLPIDDIIEMCDVPLTYIESYYYNDKTYFIDYINFDFFNEEDFLNTVSTYRIDNGFLNFYFVFPNTDRYSLGFNSEYFSLSHLSKFTFIQPYNANINDSQTEYTKGYNNGYFVGQRDALDDTYRLPFLTGIFNAVSDILALEIFPNVRLGYFVLIPLAFGVTGMIFWFWRKD